MSQQEFEMGQQASQQNSSNEEDEIQQPQYPYSWSGKMDKERVPRDEPPSSYDGTVLQQGYQAQTPNTSNTPTQQSQVNNQYQYIPPAGDGDAYEQGYRPYRYQNTQQGVPPWARPQHHRYGPARFAFIIFVLLIVGVLMAIFGALSPFIGEAIGALILVLLLILFVPLVILFIIFVVIFRILRPRRIRYRYRRRGSWW